MKNTIAALLKSLNSVGVESSLSIFRNCFYSLSFSFKELSVEQLENWIKQLKSPKLNEIWSRQKEIYPSFILYFAMWHFRDKVIQEKGYSREVLGKQNIPDINAARVEEITTKINQEIIKLSTFEGVAFLGSLIGAWMLSCPKVSILSASSSMPNSQPNGIWIKSVFPDTLGKDELELLYRLDYWLYCTFEDWEVHNTE